jgi:hypothetical protein
VANTQLFRSLPEFYHRWAPVTWRIGFLEAPRSKLDMAVFPWMQRTRGRIRASRVEGNGGDVLFSHLLPFGGTWKVMWCATKSNWIAYLENSRQGTHAQAPISYLATLLKCRSIVVGCIPHTHIGRGKTAKGAYGAVQFELYGPMNDPEILSNTLRWIDVAKDAERPWKFYESGARLPFEEVEKYSDPDVHQRFSPDMLVRHCEQFGIRLYDEDFYGPGAGIWEFIDSSPSEEWSLKEAQEHYLIADLK